MDLMDLMVILVIGIPPVSMIREADPQQHGARSAMQSSASQRGQTRAFLRAAGDLDPM